MKKVFFYFLALFACAACTTDNDTPVTPDESVQVTFNVSSLDVDVQPMHARTRAAVPAGESSLTEIRYYIWDDTRYKSYTGTQTATDAGDDFGKVVLNLPVGSKYHILFWGLNGNNPGGTFSYNAKPSAGMGLTSSSYFSVFNKETFYQYINEGVTAITNTTKELDVSLSRVVGQLIVNFTDTELPEGVAKVEMNYEYYTQFVPVEFGVNEYRTTDFSKTFAFGESGCTPLSFYLLPTKSARPLTIEIFDESGASIGTTSTYVPIYANRRTIVTGSLAEIFSGRSLSVSVNEEWGTDNTITLH